MHRRNLASHFVEAGAMNALMPNTQGLPTRQTFATLDLVLVALLVSVESYEPKPSHSATFKVGAPDFEGLRASAAQEI